MSGYDIKRNTSLNLMGSRLGIVGGPPQPQNGENQTVEAIQGISLDGLNHQGTLLAYNGGFPQQDRMILDKRRSLDRALKYSYQGAFIKKVDDSAVPWSVDRGDADNTPKIRALINPNKLKSDYDDKIISVPYEHGFKAGDVFEWCNTDTKWLITSQNKTELAYFRGDIRRCNYKLRWIDEHKQIHECYAASRGPVETKINFIQKSQISLDTPNLSLNILMPKRADVIEYFKRYKKFYVHSSLYEEDPEVDVRQYQQICFRVEAIDWISTPGVFEMTAVEYYWNENEDDIDAGLAYAGALVPEAPKNPNPEVIENKIIGDTFIKPKQVYTYKFNGFALASHWDIDSEKYPDVKYEINPNDVKEIRLMWDNPYSGQFEIGFMGVVKTIVVESLF